MSDGQLFATGLLGLVYAFAGYRWIRFTTRLAATVLFALIAGLLLQDRVTHLFQAGLMMAAGVLGFLIGDAIYVVVVFLYGAAAGALLAGAAPDALLIAAALIGGLLALIFERPLVIVASSVIGGFLLASLVQLAARGTMPHALSPAALSPSALVLAALGVAVQAATTSRPLPEAGLSRRPGDGLP